MFKKLFGDLGGILGHVWTTLTEAVDIILHFKTHITNLLANSQRLISDIEEEVNGIKNFQFDPKWKTRVISVPRLIDEIQTVAAIPADIVTRVKDLISLITQKLEPTKFEIKELKFIPEKIALVLEKILGILALFLDAVTTIEQAVEDLNSIVDDIHKVRTDVESLDGFFLPQGSTKKLVDEHYRKRIRS